MKRIVAIAGLLLAACTPADTAEVVECEADIVFLLLSPSLYERIDAKRFIRPAEPAVAGIVRDRLNLGPVPDGDIRMVDIYIEHDRPNVHGTPIRAIEHCQWARMGRGDPLRLNPPITGSDVAALAPTEDLGAIMAASEQAAEAAPPKRPSDGP